MLNAELHRDPQLFGVTAEVFQVDFTKGRVLTIDVDEAIVALREEIFELGCG